MLIDIAIAVYLHLNQLRRIQFGTVRIKQQPLPVGTLAQLS
ncbi:MAG: hypothetical protein V7K54_17135 [Nostoc sp.]